MEKNISTPHMEQSNSNLNQTSANSKKINPQINPERTNLNSPEKIDPTKPMPGVNDPNKIDPTRPMPGINEPEKIDPTRPMPGVNDPNKIDPTRSIPGVNEPEKIDPTRIVEPTPVQPEP
ncbi:MAG: hypothetical protein H7296_13110 [Bacteroidia bacterium]|nr:hypothetical protein [Bacteroidia bacterium]